MAEVRQRKTSSKSAASDQVKSSSSTKAAPQKAEEPQSILLGVAFVLFSLLVGSSLYYYIENANDGPFAQWVNAKVPALQHYLNTPSKPLFGVAAQETTSDLRLTEAELRAFDGTDPEKPIYLAISGTIFDVSASPKFYGPDGMYGHFAGRDAARAWVSECWGEEEQLTWRLDGLEELFLPVYADEQLEAAGQGGGEDATQPLAGLVSQLPPETAQRLARLAREKLPKLTDAERAKRLDQDLPAAQKKIDDKLQHWTGFFTNSPKYQVVGTVVHDEDKPAPPPLCPEQIAKRPTKPGRLTEIAAALMAEAQDEMLKHGTHDEL